MSDSSGRKKKANKPSGSPASPSSGSERMQAEEEVSYSSGKLKTMYSEAFGDEDGLAEVLRPMQKPKSKEERRNVSRAQKAKERAIHADYSYQYDFSDTSSPAGSSRSKGHKTQTKLTRSDLATVLAQLDVEKIKSEMAKSSSASSDQVSQFGALVESLETILLQARDEVPASNADKWASFNTPIGHIDIEVVDFLNDWVEDNLNSEQQTAAANYLITRMLGNIDKPVNASAGYGLKLAAQVLFRKSAWSVLESLDAIKRFLPRVGALHSLPERYAYTVLFIGAQLLANTEDADAAFAGFAFALEILGYAGLYSKNSMCNEFIARSYGRYRKNHPDTIDEYHIRLNGLVAERTLLDLHNVTSSKNVAFDALRNHLPGMQELILHMALLSSSDKQITTLFNKVAIHSPHVCAVVLSKLSPESIEKYDNDCKKAVRRLVNDLALQVAGKGPKSLPPLDPELQPAVSALLKRFHAIVSAHASAAASSPSSRNKNGKRGRGEDEAHHHRHERYGARRTSFCGRIFRLLLFIGFIYGCVLYWRHYVAPETKEILHKLSAPMCDATKPYVKLAQDSVEKARVLAQPHLDTAWQAVEPHYNTAHAAIKPHLDTACKVSAPYVQLAREKSVEAFEFSKVQLAQFCKFSKPHIATATKLGRQYLTIAGKYLDQLPSTVCNAYKTHVAPSVNPLVEQAKQVLAPYTGPVCKAVTPYWHILVEKIYQAGQFLDNTLNMK